MSVKMDSQTAGPVETLETGWTHVFPSQSIHKKRTPHWSNGLPNLAVVDLIIIIRRQTITSIGVVGVSVWWVRMRTIRWQDTPCAIIWVSEMGAVSVVPTVDVERRFTLRTRTTRVRTRSCWRSRLRVHGKLCDRLGTRIVCGNVFERRTWLTWCEVFQIRIIRLNEVGLTNSVSSDHLCSGLSMWALPSYGAKQDSYSSESRAQDWTCIQATRSSWDLAARVIPGNVTYSRISSRTPEIAFHEMVWRKNYHDGRRSG